MRLHGHYDRLKSGAGRGEALRQVELAMLARKETSHPNLWASFIVIGDWTALDEAPVPAHFKARPFGHGCACALSGQSGTDSPKTLAFAGLTLLSVAGRRRRDRIARRPGGSPS